MEPVHHYKADQVKHGSGKCAAMTTHTSTAGAEENNGHRQSNKDQPCNRSSTNISFQKHWHCSI